MSYAIHLNVLFESLTSSCGAMYCICTQICAIKWKTRNYGEIVHRCVLFAFIFYSDDVCVCVVRRHRDNRKPAVRIKGIKCSVGY